MDKDKLIELITKEIMKKLFQKKALVLSEKKCENLNKTFLDEYSLEYYNENLNLDDYELVVVPELSIEEVSALALGLPNSKMVGIIIRALFKGKKVIVLKEGLEHRRYKETAKGNLYKLYLDYEHKITLLGVEIEQEMVNNSFHSIEENQQKNIKCDKKEIVVSTENIVNKKVITEADLRKLQMKGIRQIEIYKNAIITPLAKDFIRTNKIQIKTIS